MTYKLTRKLPDGTVKAWGAPFATIGKAAQAVAYCLADNGLVVRSDAAAFASEFQAIPAGTEVLHESSGYVFRAEKS